MGLREGKDVVDDNANYIGARVVLLIMDSIHNFKEIKRLTMIMTHFVERFHGDVINQ